MAKPRRSKKMPPPPAFGAPGKKGHETLTLPDRRTVLVGLFAAAAAGLKATPVTAQQSRLALRARPVPFAAGGPGVTTFGLEPALLGRVPRGTDLTVAFRNDLPVPVVPQWHGLGGAVSVPAVAPGAEANWTLPLRHAGTRLLDLRLLQDTASPPLPAGVLVVGEDGVSIADRDEVLLIEEWRLGDGHKPVAPGTQPTQAQAIFTFNDQAMTEIAIRPNERLRLRLVNGSHRTIVALKIFDHDVTIIAIDGQPAEPFPARNGELMLAPAGRIDVIIDGASRASGTTSDILLHDGLAPRPLARLVYGATPLRPAALPAVAPLPPNGLPERLELQNAHRVELAFDGKQSSSWPLPTELNSGTPPAFTTKRGRVVVATLVNRAPAPAVFHLGGHHARLLDRLDDGWKPFWVDTVVVPAGQPQRIAFLAETEGMWMIDAMTLNWMAPRLARMFKVDA